MRRLPLSPLVRFPPTTTQSPGSPTSLHTSLYSVYSPSYSPLPSPPFLPPPSPMLRSSSRPSPSPSSPSTPPSPSSRSVFQFPQPGEHIVLTHPFIASPPLHALQWPKMGSSLLRPHSPQSSVSSLVWSGEDSVDDPLFDRDVEQNDVVVHDDVAEDDVVEDDVAENDVAENDVVENDGMEDRRKLAVLESTLEVLEAKMYADAEASQTWKKKYEEAVARAVAAEAKVLQLQSQLSAASTTSSSTSSHPPPPAIATRLQFEDDVATPAPRARPPQVAPPLTPLHRAPWELGEQGRG